MSLEKANELHRKNLNELLNELENIFDLIIQNTSNEILEEITKKLKGHNIKIEMQNKPWVWDKKVNVPSISIIRISKKQFNNIEEIILRMTDYGPLLFECIFSDSNHKFWFTHDSDIREI